jgi:hypothetical protein
MATLYKSDGTRTEVQPANGRKGFQLDELYKLLGCDTIEIVRIDAKRIMVIDEEGKYRKPIVYNREASRIMHGIIQPGDFIVGHALVCLSREVKLQRGMKGEH